MSSAAISMHGSSWSRRRDAAVLEEEMEEDFDGFYYRVVAFNGVRNHANVASTGIQVCGLISCLSKDLRSCGKQTRGLGSPAIKWTEFESVDIEGEFEAVGTLQMASTQAGPRYEPLPSVAFTLQSTPTSSSNTRVHLSIQKPLLDLRTFAIYGRYFAWDGQRPTGT